MGADLLDFDPITQVGGNPPSIAPSVQLAQQAADKAPDAVLAPSPFRLGETVYACFGDSKSFYFARITKIYTRGGQQVCDVAWLRPQAGTEGGKLYAFDDGQEDTMHREGLLLSGLRRIAQDQQSIQAPLQQTRVTAQRASCPAIPFGGSSGDAFADMLGEPVASAASVAMPSAGPDLIGNAAAIAALSSAPRAKMEVNFAQPSMSCPPASPSPVAQLQAKLASLSQAQTPVTPGLSVPASRGSAPQQPCATTTIEVQQSAANLQRRATTGSFIPSLQSASRQSGARPSNGPVDDKFGFLQDLISPSAPRLASRKSCC